jgi:hypothetical protein
MNNDRPSKLKRLSDELSARSKTLIVSDDVPHFFWILDTETDECGYFGNISSGDASRIVEILARQHGKEILDRVADNLVEESDDLDFKTLVECPPIRMNSETYDLVKEAKKKA